MPQTKEASGNGRQVITPAARKNFIAPALREAGLVVPLASLVPDPDNARLHPERNIEAVKQSLSLYGQLEPLVVRAENRMIAAGNGRRDAMLALGWDECAATVVPMTDAEFHGFALADNRSAELASWDVQTVARLQKLLEGTGHGTTGWSAEDLEVLRLAAWEPPNDGGNGTTDVTELWQGMPEFVQDDLTSFKRAIVHFRDEEDFGRFLELLGQTTSDVSQGCSLWFPRIRRESYADKRWTTANETADEGGQPVWEDK
jgi:hypothetical protein